MEVCELSFSTLTSRMHSIQDTGGEVLLEVADHEDPPSVLAWAPLFCSLLLELITSTLTMGLPTCETPEALCSSQDRLVVV